MHFAYTAVVQDESLSVPPATRRAESAFRRLLYTMDMAILVLLCLAAGLITGSILAADANDSDNDSSISSPSYQTGFATELLLPSDHITLSIQKFSGNPFFLPNGTEVIQLDPRKPRYVGAPSPEVDDAWEYLLHGRYFPIYHAEAKAMWGDAWLKYKPGRDAEGNLQADTDYISGTFDVFHSLHCLNQLRKRLSPDYYTPTHLHGRVHHMHCINHLRQVLQCSSVASIIPSLYRPTVDMQYSDAGQPHVCRDFAAIHNYTRERYSVLGSPLMEWRDVML